MIKSDRSSTNQAIDHDRSYDTIFVVCFPCVEAKERRDCCSFSPVPKAFCTLEYSEMLKRGKFADAADESLETQILR